MAVVYCNVETGSTTTILTALTSCIASNPSGTTTRINKVGHGLTTGQIVNLTLFTTWLNRSWSINVVDADNFDLVEAVWQTTADTNGTVTPMNGYSWATAIKNPLSFFGALTAVNNEKVPVEMRMEKSPDPYSVGNATWTNGSGTVTLATAQTATIDNCEVAWTAANSSTVTRITTTPVKEGTYRASIVLPSSGITTNTKYAYYTLPSTLDLSAYQRISYWLQQHNTSSITADTQWKICLCSDTTGDTVVDEFLLPRNNYSGQLTHPFTVAKDGGGNLGSSIASIAVYSGSTTPSGSTGIRLDNIIACTSTGLNLTSVISKNDSATYDHTKETWHPIDYIDGTDIQLSNNINSNWNTTNLSYYKYMTSATSPETVTTYAREAIFYSTYDSLSSYLLIPYQSDGLLSVSGGWNSSTDTLDGMTFLLGRGVTYPINDSSGSASQPTRFAEIKNFGFIDWSGLLSARSSYMQSCYASNCYAIRSRDRNVYSDAYLYDIKIENCTLNNASGNGGILFGNNKSVLNNIKWINSFSRCEISVFFNSTMTNVFMQANLYNSASGHYLYANQSTTSNITIESNPTPASSNKYGVQFRNNFSLYALNRINGLTIKNCRHAIVGMSGSSPTILDNLVLDGNLYSFYLSTGGTTLDVVTNNLTSTDTNFIQFDNNIPSYNTYFSIINNAVGGNKDAINHYYKLYCVPLVANTAWGATVQAQTTERHTASGIAWQINPLTTALTSTNPFKFKIASVAVNDSSLVTVKAWVKLSHATDIGAKLFIPSGQISGPTSDTTATKTADTNWEELTVTFTPAIQGVVDIYLQAYWLANTADKSVYVDDITVSQ